MNTELLITFIILNIVNVIIQTAKSIATIKCGKFSAAAVNAIAYGLYTVVIVMTNCALELWLKCIIVAVTNFIGVYAVKFIEEKIRKDKIWKVEATIPKENTDSLHIQLKQKNIPHNYIENIGKYNIFNIFCDTQKESVIAKQILQNHNAKYFVTETKIL